MEFDVVFDPRIEIVDGPKEAEKVVALNMADGDQTVTAEDGTLLKSVTIQRPKGLKAANVREGVDVGGVTGALKAQVEPLDNGINFYDYDGTVLHAWTLEELAEQTALPELPSHPGLICQGWNWSLEDLRTTGRAMEVGASYITDDGATRLYLHIDAEGTTTIPLYFRQSVANGVTVDWGDGSAAETFAATTVSATHDYSAGDYVLSLLPAEGCNLILGHDRSGLDSLNRSIIGYSDRDEDAFARQAVYAIEVGRNVTALGLGAFDRLQRLQTITIPVGVLEIKKAVFYNCTMLHHITLPAGVTGLPDSSIRDCWSLQSVSIPNGVVSVGWNALYAAYALRRATLPDGAIKFSSTGALSSCWEVGRFDIPAGVTSLPGNTFQTDYQLRGVTFPAGLVSIGSQEFSLCRSLLGADLPESLETIGAGAFINCYSLRSVKLRAGIASIGNNAFKFCYNLKVCDCTECTAVPTLGSSVFQSAHADFKILVPSALEEEWKAAANWSSYASQIIGV